MRVTVVQPDRPGAIARLSTAIAQAGGNLTVMVSYPAVEPGMWSSLLKVTDIPWEGLKKTIDKLEEIEIRDVREI